MSQYVGIVGSRFPKDMPPQLRNAVRRQIKDYVDGLPDGTVVVSGGEPSGADHWAETYAKARKLAVMTFPARWRREDGSIDKSAGFARNGAIVDVSDRIVAFWDGRSRGTVDTMVKAKKAKKKLEIIRWPELETA